MYVYGGMGGGGLQVRAFGGVGGGGGGGLKSDTRQARNSMMYQNRYRDIFCVLGGRWCWEMTAADFICIVWQKGGEGGRR